MAPRKEKSEKSWAPEGSSMIIEYLKKQNRPYSAIEVSANLHNKVTKTQSVKLLKELHDRNLIAGKASGKQMVYHAIQLAEDSATPEELGVLDKETENLQEEINSYKSEERSLKSTLGSLEGSMTLLELQAAIRELENRKELLLSRLGPLRVGKVHSVSSKEKEKVESDNRLWKRRATARKEICTEFWAVLTQELPEGKTDEELWEEKGLERDP